VVKKLKKKKKSSKNSSQSPEGVTTPKKSLREPSEEKISE